MWGGIYRTKSRPPPPFYPGGIGEEVQGVFGGRLVLVLVLVALVWGGGGGKGGGGVYPCTREGGL